MKEKGEGPRRRKEKLSGSAFRVRRTRAAGSRGYGSNRAVGTMPCVEEYVAVTKATGSR